MFLLCSIENNEECRIPVYKIGIDSMRSVTVSRIYSLVRPSGKSVSSAFNGYPEHVMLL